MSGEPESLVCRAEDVIGLIQGKWKLPILTRLSMQPMRFGALRRSVQGISQKVLTQELKDLAGHQVVSRTVHGEVPRLNVEYALTDLGRRVSDMLCGLSEWARENLDGQAGPTARDPRT